jgi:hypothetical protein
VVEKGVVVVVLVDVEGAIVVVVEEGILVWADIKVHNVPKLYNLWE